jgi:hypothetical protein
MESSEASWHPFDPSGAMEDSEAMAQLLGVQYFVDNEQKQPASMYWPGQDADQYCGGGSAPYHMQHLDTGSSYDDLGYYGTGTVTMTGDFFVPGEEMADPNLMLDLNLDLEDQDGGKPPTCKRKIELEQKDESTATGTVPPSKKKGSSTAAAPVSVMNSYQIKRAFGALD